MRNAKRVYGWENVGCSRKQIAEPVYEAIYKETTNGSMIEDGLVLR